MKFHAYMYEEAAEEARTSNDTSGLILRFKQLADELRQEFHREQAGASDLPLALTVTLRLAKDKEDEELAVQCGRVAANFVANNDANRESLVQAGYVEIALLALPLGVRALIASLLNLVVDGHESATRAVAPHLATLLRLNVDDDIRIWIWTIANALEIENPSTELQSLLCQPFQLYTSTNEKILELASEVISTASIQNVATLYDFVEFAETDAAVKGNVIRAIVDCDSTDMERMAAWLDGREDMQMCALLCYGNRATTEPNAVEVLRQILPKLIPLLVPESSVQLQHACIGLLRNLSVPPKNKETLHEYNIPSRLQRMGVWQDTRDMVGSVQGGAIGVVKNLCRDNLANSLQFVQNADAVGEVLGVIGRSDDPPTRYEGTRIFVNVLRTGSSNPILIERCGDERVVKAFSRMLKEGGEYPLLLNEAIIALAILAKFGNEETRDRIRSSLDAGELRTLDSDAKIKENADALAILLESTAS